MTLKKAIYIHILLTKCEVKMAGYCPSSHRISLYCHKKYSAKENLCAPTWALAKFYCRTKQAIPSRQYCSTLPKKVANHSAGLIKLSSHPHTFCTGHFVLLHNTNKIGKLFFLVNPGTTTFVLEFSCNANKWHHHINKT